MVLQNSRIARRAALALFLMNIYCFVHAQVKWGAILQGGISSITGKEGTLYNDKDLYYNIDIRPGPSYCAGFSYSRGVNSRSFFEIQFLVNFAECREDVTWIMFKTTGDVLFIHNSTSYEKIGLLSFPLIYGINYKEFLVRFGFQASGLPLDYGKQTGYDWSSCDSINYVRQFDYNIAHSYDSYDYGLKLGISYKLSARLAFDIDLYYGLNSLIDTKGFPNDEKIRIRQGLIGLRYDFYNSVIKDKDKWFISR